MHVRIGERDHTYYLKLDSLCECWILETDALRLQQYVRPGGDWLLRASSGAGARRST